ncbi:MAG: hypothetical protein ACRBG0_27770 [Lewinella sp.]|uniref:hypothetical protein n=1 Tax=Lewinella sp. TaxID=2004506 RepID=UPI003D6BE71B
MTVYKEVFRLKDLELATSTAVSGSSAVYTTAADLGESKRATNANIQIVVDLTFTSGSFVFALLGKDADNDLSSGATTAYTFPAKTATETFNIPIPPDFQYRYVGYSLTAVAHAGTVETYVQDNKITDM